MNAYTPPELPRWAVDILNATPERGGGLNRWFLRAAIALRRCGRDDHEIYATLRAATADQPTKPGEIERAVERSAQFMSDQPGAIPPRRWTTSDETLRGKIIDQAGGIEVAELWERSPYRLVDDGKPDAEELIDWLFPGDDTLLCAAETLPTAHTASRAEWRGKLAGLQFIVPNAMNARTGRTQDGKTSSRCLENTGTRMYLVVEQDDGTADEQAAILLHLAEHAPLVLVCTSGNKSLHGWFSCDEATETQLKTFFDYAVRCGADPATWTPCQMVRLPEGTRDNGNRQAVLFLSMEAA